MARHVIVDGSNLATEGRAMPSLRQLADAVQAFIDENPDDLITVVVDATFGHRIDPKEVPEFEAAIEHNEMVAPPAGAVGRGDAFILAIAKKAGAVILTNDSYQEFHAEHDWIFDEGRLIGGKPVPHIGWVFVTRVPVRGPISRKVQREARGGRGRDKAAAGSGRSKRSAENQTAVIGSPEASRPMPVPKAPPPNVRAAAPVAPAAEAQPSSKSRGRGGRSVAPEAQPVKPSGDVVAAVPGRTAMVNDLLPFLSFVEHHPVGSSVDVTIESYSSHGAYGTVGETRVYLPLRNISDPAPRSAREAVKLGDTISLVVHALHPARRGIDMTTSQMAPSSTPAPAEASPVKASRGRGSRKAPDPTPSTVAADVSVVEAAVPDSTPDAVAKPAKPKRASKAAASAAAAAEPSPLDETPSARARARRSPRPPASEPTTPTTTPAATATAVAQPAPARATRAKKTASPDAVAPSVASSIKAAVTKAKPAPASTAKPATAAKKVAKAPAAAKTVATKPAAVKAPANKPAASKSAAKKSSPNKA